MLDMKTGFSVGAKTNLDTAYLSSPPVLRIPPPSPSHVTPTRRADLATLEAQLRELTPNLRVAVVYGGDKEAPGAVLYRSANTRPWKSYLAVAEDIRTALRELGLRNVELVADDMNMPAT